MPDKLSILRQYFGYTQFRPGQEALIDGVLSGRDVLGIMPTGGGKSLCYQVPALMLPGLTLVVSPLISLMQDQVMALTAAGIRGAYLNSALNPEQRRAVFRGLRAGQYKILYVAPERLLGEGFTDLARELPISLVAVDEAHCISQWGQDFRPSYLKIVEFLELLPHRPVVAAFTATATVQVRQDIIRLLELQDPLKLVTGFDRPNLFFEVRQPQRKEPELLELLEARREKCGIVYCATRREVETVCQLLRDHDFPATRYHAGLSEEERRQNQEDFLYDRATVMVATNAFGMGIDKSNVSYVIHYNMPKNPESYYQEAGRAGRDGTPAECILLFAGKDVSTARYFIQSSGENEALSPEEAQAFQKQELRRLQRMVDYCQTGDCLRGFLLDYFGQSHPPRCGRCGNCLLSTHAQRDITVEAQMILSCARRIHSRLGYDLGSAMLIRTLCGSREKRLLELGLDTLPTYGLMKSVPRAQIQVMLTRLIGLGYLQQEAEYQTVSATPKADAVLFHGEKVTISVRDTEQAVKAQRAAETEESPDTALLEALKALRLRLARASGIPAYIIFTNASLEDMARKKPTTMEQFLTVSGVGQAKAQRHGKVFLAEIRKFAGGPAH